MTDIQPLILALLLGLAACTFDTDWNPPDNLPAPEAIGHYCESARTYRAGSGRGVAADLAATHADIRVLALAHEYPLADRALATALEPENALENVSATLAAYAQALPEVCALAVDDGQLGAGSITRTGRVALIEPGTGDLTLPDEIDAVIIDLRQIPAGPDAADAVARAVGLALDTDMSFRTRARMLTGFPDQYAVTSPYTASAHEWSTDIPASGLRALPLAFVTPRRLGPRIATIAGNLRLAQRAWLLGHDIYAAVAESHWSQIGGQNGLLWRAVVHDHPQSLGLAWPDRIPADIATTAPDALFTELPRVRVPPAIASGDIARPRLLVPASRAPQPIIADSRGVRRAALMSAHGTLNGFYPHFDVVGHGIDDALTRELANADTLPADDRFGVARSLGRLLHSVHDGQAQITDLAAPPPVGYLDAQLDRIGDMAVIRSSAHADISAGDTIIAIDSTEASGWFATAMARHSAATEHYRFARAARELQSMLGQRQFTLRDSAGVQRTVTASPQTPLTTPEGGTLRPSGWLANMGAPDVLFLNLSRHVTLDWAQLDLTLPQLVSARALVIDLRDQPAIDHLRLARYLRTQEFSAPVVEVLLRQGPGRIAWQRTRAQHAPEATAFSGPIAVLIGHKTVSRAEELLLLLTGATNVTRVGQRSAGTAGDVTRASLPGGYVMSFTSMRVLYADGSHFHGVGVAPDVEVVPAPTELQSGMDPELTTAVMALQ